MHHIISCEYTHIVPQNDRLKQSKMGFRAD